MSIQILQKHEVPGRSRNNVLLLEVMNPSDNVFHSQILSMLLFHWFNASYFLLVFLVLKKKRIYYTEWRELMSDTRQMLCRWEAHHLAVRIKNCLLLRIIMSSRQYLFIRSLINQFLGVHDKIYQILQILSVRIHHWPKPQLFGCPVILIFFPQKDKTEWRTTNIYWQKTSLDTYSRYCTRRFSVGQLNSATEKDSGKTLPWMQQAI